MRRARTTSLPRDYGGALLQLHDRKPFPNSAEEIAAARARGDATRNFRIETAEDGIHVYNRDGHHVAQDAFSLFPKLGVDDRRRRMRSISAPS